MEMKAFETKELTKEAFNLTEVESAILHSIYTNIETAARNRENSIIEINVPVAVLYKLIEDGYMLLTTFSANRQTRISW